MLLDARPLREGCLFVVALKAAAGAPRGGGGISSTNKKNIIFKNLHPFLAPGPFWPHSDADRTLTTTVRCVVRRGRESGRRSPKGRAPWVSQRGVGEGHDPQVRVMSRDANNDTLCIQSPGLEPCSQRTPERPQKQRITTVRWPLLGTPGRGPPRHPWGTEGAAKTAPNENSEPL